MNDFAQVMLYAWNIMCTPFTLYGFDLSYGEIYLFSLLITLVAIGVFEFLWRY